MRVIVIIISVILLIAGLIGAKATFFVAPVHYFQLSIGLVFVGLVCLLISIFK